mgnify:CR=1 FL=1|tara:strand:- start:459 stop:3110 length:2652 start_codon:yes stop_codon:yes gene_type:complete
MTDSYFSALGRAADAPPDISKTNYLDTEPDMAKAVNDNITAISNSWDEHYNQMIEIYKHIHKQKSPAENLLQVLKQGKEFKDEFEAWQDEWEDINNFSAQLNEQHALIKPIAGDDPDAYIKALQNIGSNDPDIKKELDNEAELAASRVPTNTEGYRQLDSGGDIQLANKLIEGPNSIFLKQVELDTNIKNLKEGLPGWLKVSDEGIKHHLESFGYTADGQPIFKSLNEATLPEEKFEIRLRNIAWYTYLHKDVARGRFGKYKKDFLKDVLLDQDAWKKTVLEDYAAASLETITKRNNEEFAANLEKDPGGTFMTQVTTHAGHPEFLNAKGNTNHALVLDRYTEKLEDIFRDGMVEDPVSVLKKLGNYEFRAFGHPEGSTVKFKHHWKKRYGKLVAAVKEYQEAEKKARESEREVAQNSDQKEIADFCGSNSFDQCKARIAAYDTTWGTSDENRPTALNNLLYNVREPEADQIERLERIKLTRPLTKNDIKGLTVGTPAHDQYLKEIEAPLAVGSVKRGPGSFTYRDRAIKSRVAFTLKMDVDEVQGNPKATIMMEKAESIYNQAYYGLKSFDINTTNAQAHTEAMEQVKDLLTDPEAGTERTSVVDLDAVKTVNKSVAAVAKNPDILNQSNPLEGEEPYIELGAKFLDDYMNGRGGTAPNYYKSMAAKLGTTVPKVIRTRLEGLGRIKEGQVVFPEEGKPGERLLVNPTAAKTIRVYNLNEDYEWMLESSKSPAAIANGGYLSVSDKDGNYVSLEEVTQKPMESITMGDVVNLIASDYTGFGIYEIPSYDLIDILQTNGVPMDMIFDEDGQDFLYLAALRHKAQKAQRNTGIVTDYRRLVNIDKDLHDKFNELAGDLVKGKPWLDLNNLAPEVAKEFIRELTQ